MKIGEKLCEPYYAHQSYSTPITFVESGNGITISTFTPGHINETSAAVAAMMYKRYEHEIEQARLKFKSEVEKNGYYAMNKNFKEARIQWCY